MKNAIIFIICFLIYSCTEKPKVTNEFSKHKLSAKVQLAVDSLSVIEYVDNVEEKNKRYLDLIKVANLKDLIFLTNYKVPEIRCYAFVALTNRNYLKIKEVFYEHQKDTALVETRMNDLIDHESVAGFMLQQIGPFGMKNKYHFNRKEFDIQYEKIKTMESKLKPKPEPEWNDSIKKWKHLDLEYTQEYYWADSDDEDFEEKRKLIDKPIKFSKFDYNVLVTAYFELNGCNSYFPNIERKGDTVILKEQLFFKGHCDRKLRRIEKVNFFINNQNVNEIRYVRKQ